MYITHLCEHNIPMGLQNLKTYYFSIPNNLHIEYNKILANFVANAHKKLYVC